MTSTQPQGPGSQTVAASPCRRNGHHADHDCRTARGGNDWGARPCDHLVDIPDGKVTLLGRVFFEDSTDDADYITLTRVQMDGVFDNGFD